MKRKAEDFEVFVNKAGTVTVAQENSQDDPSLVVIHPQQIDLLCTWLREVAAEAVAETDQDTLDA